jgi:glutamyl-tRNA reductase
MSLLVLGVSHRSAPMAVLDDLALSADAVEGLGRELMAHDAINEAVVLSTCNRLEIYADAPRFHPAVAAVIGVLARVSGVDPEVLRGA